MKSILLLFVFLLTQLFAFAQSSVSIILINPTGTYSFNGKTIEKNGETYEMFGTIKVKLLQNSKIAISLYVCKGAMSYSSGSFVDTLEYKNNRATFTTPEFDSTCKIVFTFKQKKFDSFTDPIEP